MWILLLITFLLNFFLVWDATAKSTEGILRGSTFQMGDFDECITVKAPFVTQYCLATIKAHVPLKNPRKDPLSLHFHPHDSVLARIHVSGLLNELILID